MTLDVQASVWIAAPPAQVWRVVADLPAYAQWNPLTPVAEGTLLEGAPLRVRTALAGRRPARRRAEVQCVVPPQELRWASALGVRGVLDHEHAWQLQPLGDGTHVVQRQRYRGLLTPLLRSTLRETLQAGVEASTLALRTRAEQLVAREAA